MSMIWKDPFEALMPLLIVTKDDGNNSLQRLFYLTAEDLHQQF